MTITSPFLFVLDTSHYNKSNSVSCHGYCFQFHCSCCAKGWLGVVLGGQMSVFLEASPEDWQQWDGGHRQMERPRAPQMDCQGCALHWTWWTLRSHLKQMETSQLQHLQLTMRINFLKYKWVVYRASPEQKPHQAPGQCRRHRWIHPCGLQKQSLPYWVPPLR